MRESLAVVAAVLRNPVLARIQGGYALFSIGEWAAWLAIAVYAFERGGAAEAGLVGFVMGLAGLVVAPLGGVLGDRYPRARVLLASYVLQTAAVLATAVTLFSGVAPLAYVFATASAASIALARPALASLLPEVVETPDELTAANVASGIADGVGALAGPLAAGLLLAVAGSAVVFVACALGLIVAVLALLPIARASEPMPNLGAGPSDAPTVVAASRLAVRELTAGVRAIAHDRRLSGVFVVLAMMSALLGAAGVFTIVIAIDLLGMDDSVAAYLTAAAGLGSLVGSGLAATLVGRERLGVPMILATVGYGIGITLLAFVQSPVVIALILMAAGVGYSFAYVAATTLIQRLVGDDVMNRVFGVSESTATGAESIGGLIVPLLIVLFGPTGGIVAAGLAVPVVVALVAPTFIRADRAGAHLLAELRAIRGVAMFRPLSAPMLERLAGGAIPVAAGARDVVIRAGDHADRFYIVTSGRADIEVDGAVTGEVGPGAGIGEIALLHDVARTATIRAIEPMTLLAIQREPFLEALTGQPRSRAMADKLAQSRLARDAGEP